MFHISSLCNKTCSLGRSVHWFKQSVKFLNFQICGTESSSKIFLIGLLFAVLSGCSVSIVVVFLGRIKHILLRSNSQTELFLKRIYEQIIILMLVVVLAAATHFGMVILTSFHEILLKSFWLGRQVDQTLEWTLYVSISLTLEEFLKDLF